MPRGGEGASVVTEAHTKPPPKRHKMNRQQLLASGSKKSVRARPNPGLWTFVTVSNPALQPVNRIGTLMCKAHMIKR